MLRKVIVVTSMGAALVSSMAFADGPVSAYDGEQDLALSPNEQVVSESMANDDGAVEDPQHRMSGTARAFRNGVINGRAMQRDEDAKVVTPLPPLPKGYAGFPAAAQVQVIPTAPIRQVALPPPPPPALPVQYAQAPEPAYPQYPRQQRPIVINVTQSAPQYAQPYSQPYQQPYPPQQQQQYYGGDDGGAMYAEAPPAQYAAAYMAPPPVYAQPRPVYVARPIIAPQYLPPSYYGRPVYQAGYGGYRQQGWYARAY
jgi:hypothetical protein